MLYWISGAQQEKTIESVQLKQYLGHAWKNGVSRSGNRRDLHQSVHLLRPISFLLFFSHSVDSMRPAYFSANREDCDQTVQLHSLIIIFTVCGFSLALAHFKTKRNY